uniref:translation initiation factor 2 n=1 Tax=Pulvinaster venetus TaxID=427767 RepID=UPI001FCD18BA|nr:translation initiation factor 2 [Pulvinaster venetus]UNJ16905.1 translation initiation factor 2 [Pulvinaster venetus]
MNKNLTTLAINSLIDLKKPMVLYKTNIEEQFIYELSQPKMLDKLQSSFMNNNFSVTSILSNSKHDKKYKHFEKIEDKLETKKNKNKQKKRNKSKLHLSEEDDNFNELTTHYKQNKDNNTSLLSLIRPERPDNINIYSINKTKKNQPLSKKKKISKIVIPQKNNEIIEPIQSNQIDLNQPITIKQLSEVSLISEQEIIKFLFLKGKLVTINEIIDLDMANAIATHFNIEINFNTPNLQDLSSNDMIEQKDLDKLTNRPPIVTIMGHVDHGKTTLLDSIRNTRSKIVDKEKGGITQLIGAYQIKINYKGKDEKITFLDTPGHEAFTGMRARGTKLTDIGILAVAANDGIKKQTLEAIEYLQKKDIPIIVALTKIDKEDANIEKVKKELTQYNIVPEDWGGTTPVVPINGITGENIDQLLEMILLTAEISNLQANPHRSAKGTILESYLDRTKGPIATLLIQNGTLKIGDIIVAGDSYGKARAITNDNDEKILEAGPSYPVKIWGLCKVAPIGENFEICKTDKEAKEKANTFHSSKSQEINLNFNLLNEYKKQEKDKCLRIIIKTNTQGSIEAIIHSLSKIPQNLINLQIMNISVGEITENDVELAYSANAYLIGFNTTLASGAKQSAEKKSIQIKEYNIIYDLIEDTISKMESLLEPEYKEEEIGKSEVKTIFSLSKGVIAGCYVNSGKLKKDAWIHIIRNNDIIYKGNLESLKKVKDDITEIEAGLECGIFIKNFQDWKVGDLIKCYNLTEQKQSLTSLIL